MSTRRALGWAGFAAAVAWLWYDYQVKAGKDEIDHAIMAGWATLILTAGHVLISMRG